MVSFKSKPRPIISVILIILLIIAQPIYYSYKYSNNCISVYEVEKTTNDLALTIEGLTLVSLEKGLYIQPNYLIRTSNNNQDKIKDIELIASVDKKEIIKMYMGDLLSYGYDYPTYVKGVKVNDDSILNIEFTYEFKGVKKEFHEDLRLKDYETELVEY